MLHLNPRPWLMLCVEKVCAYLFFDLSMLLSWIGDRLVPLHCNCHSLVVVEFRRLGHRCHCQIHLLAGSSNLQWSCKCSLILLYLLLSATLTLLRTPRTIRCSSQTSNWQDALLHWRAIPNTGRVFCWDGCDCNEGKLWHFSFSPFDMRQFGPKRGGMIN